MKRVIVILLVVFLIYLTYQFLFNTGLAKPAKIQITSSSFENKGVIPDTHACDILGEDRSPPLIFSNIPEGTKSLALILDDPDAPGGAFNHWVIFNIPRNASGLDEGLPKDANLEGGIKQGINGTEQIGYFGPCPPPRETHRYIFKLYAVDISLDTLSVLKKRTLLQAMKGHIIGRGKLVGLYKNNTNL